ncbi:beta-ketoacyl-[acyl-carrier-protein] synthase family protein [Subsaxibacter sp. CAU 1640]|uniref:beta-ketoacyl-[acyl-carrier-protein] synthase family protein n=1 Tax=Subsaxibacter sp. CAU 1640 TaxID=2933271 RepID=UPI002003819F|nr:beta-ketoacyl-[acyl-carrier-protein] synthase family protein [Subsaxibacter sp. CAU 1640]MCK7589454.1 beta-ketoacyl-[acyl-carrier-protein] synthase family protein [Subsaxibacter sp. CAU 1640]
MPNIEKNKARKGVAITGIGIISAIGNTLEENRISLLSSQSGIGDVTQIKTKQASQIKVGEVKLTNDELIDQLNLPKDNNFTRTALLGLVAAKEAVKNSGISIDASIETGFISATSVGGMDKTEIHLKDFPSKRETQKYVSSHHAGDSTQKIADALGINGFVTTISTACSSAANAIMLGARMITSGQLDRVIVGGTDALSKFTINGFKTLMILSDDVCTPFDEDRKGLNLGEAAAYLVLESDEMTKNKNVLAYLTGYGNANDAFHQTASSETGEGAFLAMQKALQIADLKSSDINYVNAHGTATPNNDLSESMALTRIFGEPMPDFSSTKSFTGHTLAAAGAIEAVFSVMALQEQTVWPNLNFRTKIEETGLEPTSVLKTKNIQNVLSNSFGFGGNCSTLIFSKR